jgi:hypothetical protein
MAQSKKRREQKAFAILDAWSNFNESSRAPQRVASVGLQRREQRKKAAALIPSFLDPKAPLGVYQLDSVIAEVISAGFISAATVEKMRETVGLGADYPLVE